MREKYLWKNDMLNKDADLYLKHHSVTRVIHKFCKIQIK